MFCERLSLPQVKVKVPRQPLVLDQTSAMTRDNMKIVQIWNAVSIQRRLPEECYKMKKKRLENIYKAVEELNDSIYRGRRLFYQIPTKCDNCEFLHTLVTYDQPLFWRQLHSSVGSLVFHCTTADSSFKSSENFKLSLVQFICDLTADKPLSVIFRVSPLICECLDNDNIDLFSPKIHCALILLWEFWLEYDIAATNSGLALGLIFYVYSKITALVNSFEANSADVSAVWNRSQQFFTRVSSSVSILNDEPICSREIGRLHWNLHLVSHLLRCLHAILRRAPSTARAFLVEQGKYFVQSAFMLSTSLAKIAKSELPIAPFNAKTRLSTWSKVVTLALDALGTSSYVIFGFARLFPAVQFQLARQLASDEVIALKYMQVLLVQPNVLAAYAHASTLYLLVSKSRNLAVRETLTKGLDVFIQVILRMPLEVPQSSQGLIIDDIRYKIEFLAFFKLGYFLIILLETLLARSPQTVRGLSVEKLQPLWLGIHAFLLKAEQHLSGFNLSSAGYDYPHNFQREEIRSLPGTAFALVVDFEDESEYSLLLHAYTSAATFAWITSVTSDQAQELITHKLTDALFKKALTGDMSWPSLCTAVAGFVRNCTKHHSEYALSVRPEIIDIVSKLFIELHCPLEAYFYLIDSVRSLFFATSEPDSLSLLRRLIGPMRSFLTSAAPKPRYYNYPNLQTVVHKQTGTAFVGDIISRGEVESENNPMVLAPQILGTTLESLVSDARDAYPGQGAIQREVSEVIKLLNPHLETDIQMKLNAIGSVTISRGLMPKSTSLASLSQLQKQRQLVRLGLHDRENEYITDQFRRHLERTTRHV